MAFKTTNQAGTDAFNVVFLPRLCSRTQTFSRASLPSSPLLPPSLLSLFASSTFSFPFSLFRCKIISLSLYTISLLLFPHFYEFFSNYGYLFSIWVKVIHAVNWCHTFSPCHPRIFLKLCSFNVSALTIHLWALTFSIFHCIRVLISFSVCLCVNACMCLGVRVCVYTCIYLSFVYSFRLSHLPNTSSGPNLYPPTPLSHERSSSSCENLSSEFLLLCFLKPRVALCMNRRTKQRRKNIVGWKQILGNFVRRHFTWLNFNAIKRTFWKKKDFST